MEVTTERQLKKKKEKHLELANKNHVELADVVKKLEIARNVLLGIRTIEIANNEKIIEQITGADGVSLNKAYENIQNKLQHSKIHTFKEVLNKRIQIQTVNNRVSTSYKELRNVIFDFYIDKRVIPTADKILSALKDKSRDDDDTASNLSTEATEDLDKKTLLMLLKNQGFKWKQVPNSSKCILIEESERIYKRIVYLQKMKQYRNEERCFIYISCSKTFAAAPTLGLLNKQTKTPLFEECDIEHWTIEKLLPIIPKASVIVLSAIKDVHKLKHAQIPTAESPKATMMSWLTAHNIPHKKLQHRAELFQLIHTYKGRISQDTTILEALFRSYGHDALVTPPELPCLDYFEFLTGLEKNDMDITAAVTKMKPEHWESLGVNLKITEDRIYEEDMQFETIVDQVLTMAKYEGVDDSEMDSCTENTVGEYHSSIILF